MRIAGKLRVTPLRIILAVILLGGVVITLRRFALGLGAVTNLSDETPWGLWIGFDVISGVALASGGFTMAFLAHIAGDRQLRPLARPAILTALIGYLLVIVGLIYDLGLPWHMPNVIFYPNYHSVMFEVAWCVMLYTVVLFMEFLPAVFERFRAARARRVLHIAAVPLYVLGIVLSTLHQSSLGSLYLIAPEKLHPLWYTQMLPLMFFLSALVVGMAMVIVEASLSARLLHHPLRIGPLVRLGQYLLVADLVYIAFRIQDLTYRGAWGHVLDGSFESWFFLLENALFLAPLLVLAHKRWRVHPRTLMSAGYVLVAAVVVHRLDVTFVGMRRGTGSAYIPAWEEVWISVFLVTCGALVFGIASRYLPVFSKEEGYESSSELGGRGTADSRIGPA
ncbi:MAG: Ni/Fe-hydrogenase cytochrome b subunit [Candidatus Eisenbacteria bacterium]|nr:Ni/Fe-hydrogenase cytochrome b subunit [Candidatus Eisenbacteria bacterium]